MASTSPYRSREEFLAHGMKGILLDADLDCSICKEPLVTALRNMDTTTSLLPLASRTEHDISHDTGSTTPKDVESAQVAEPAVAIIPCVHVFGRDCLRAWFESSDSNRCPECNQTLFPNRYIRLCFREPTRSMRLNFATYVDEVCGDARFAQEIREELMSGQVRALIREFAMELWRQQGFEVEYEYVDVGRADEEGDGDENASEYEEDTEDGDDAMGTSTPGDPEAHEENMGMHEV